MKRNFVVLAVSWLLFATPRCGDDGGPSLQKGDTADQTLFNPGHDTTTLADADAQVLADADSHTPTDGIPPGDTHPDTDAATPPDVPEGDVGCIPGTACYRNEWQIMGSMVQVIVDDQAINPDWYLLDLLPPGTLTLGIAIKSNGFNQLNLVDAFLEPGGNPNVSLQWTTPGMPGAMPLVLAQGERVEGTITYTPPANAPATPTLFTVWTSDPEHPSRTVLLKPRESGPDIQFPYSAVNYGCGSWCFAQEFQIENAGNQALVIQSTQFQTPSGEWTAQDAPPPGTTLPPKGQPGYAPYTFAIEYCDADGSYTNDSNQFLIFSNDPDENPAAINLNVQLPDQCP